MTTWSCVFWTQHTCIWVGWDVQLWLCFPPGKSVTLYCIYHIFKNITHRRGNEHFLFWVPFVGDPLRMKFLSVHLQTYAACELITLLLQRYTSHICEITFHAVLITLTWSMKIKASAFKCWAVEKRKKTLTATLVLLEKFFWEKKCFLKEGSGLFSI